MEKVTIKNSKGQKLYASMHCSATEKPKKAVIVCHGFISNRVSKWKRDLCTKLAAKGYLAIRIDFTGNGESEGKLEEGTYSQEIDDLRKFIHFVRKKGCERIGVIGHSMGGAVTMLTTAKESHIHAVATVSAPSMLGKRPYNEFLKYAERPVPDKLPKAFFDDIKKQDIKKAVQSIKVPFLIIHGDKDTVVPHKESHTLYKWANCAKQHVTMKGMNHNFRKPTDAKKLCEVAMEFFCNTV